MGFPLRLVREDADTVTLAWDAQPCDGYRMYADGKPVSRTFDPSRTSARFAKAGSYAVNALQVSEQPGGVYPEPAGSVLELQGTLTAPDFVAKLKAAPAGALTVRGPFTVNGDFTVPRKNLIVQHGVFAGVVYMDHGSDGLIIEDSTLFGFETTSGCDNWILRRNMIDGQANRDNNVVFYSRNWKIVDCTLKNYHYSPNEGIHSEALFIGAGNDGFLISGNTFYDNGTTAHIFFTWWPETNSSVSLFPKNGCVTGNTFEKTHNHFLEINAQEPPFDSQVTTIRIDPTTNVVRDAGRALFRTDGSFPKWTRPCGS